MSDERIHASPRPEQSDSLPRCVDCRAALARWDEPHTVDDCQAYRDLSPADQAAYEEAVEIIRAERCSS